MYAQKSCWMLDAGEPRTAAQGNKEELTPLKMDSSTDVLIHELKQPLLCILVLAERLEAALKDVGTNQFTKAPSARRDVASILVSVLQMREIMAARSTLAHLKQIEEEWSKRLESQLEALEAVASPFKTKLIVENNIPQHERGPDLSALGQVLSNLVTNAAHAIDELDEAKGKREILIVASEKDGQAYFEVHDSGCGIPEEISSRLFAKGFSTRLTKGGSGYGLWICRKLAAALGGKLEVSASERLKGACFTLQIPFEMQAEWQDLEHVA